jgi:hypothetical protein
MTEEFIVSDASTVEGIQATGGVTADPHDDFLG